MSLAGPIFRAYRMRRMRRMCRVCRTPSGARVGRGRQSGRREASDAVDLIPVEHSTSKTFQLSSKYLSSTFEYGKTEGHPAPGGVEAASYDPNSENLGQMQGIHKLARGSSDQCCGWTPLDVLLCLSRIQDPEVRKQLKLSAPADALFSCPGPDPSILLTDATGLSSRCWRPWIVR